MTNFVQAIQAAQSKDGMGIAIRNAIRQCALNGDGFHFAAQTCH
jgi:hypothetical protein